MSKVGVLKIYNTVITVMYQHKIAVYVINSQLYLENQ